MKKLTNIFIVLIITQMVISCVDEKGPLQIIDTILHDTSSYFYTDLNPYKIKNAQLPIGIFDSGTGGLTVMDAIVNFDNYNNINHSYSVYGDSIRDFNNESFIYLADQANMPYGNYGKHDKADLLIEHCIKDVQFLMNNKYYKTADHKNYEKDKSPIKALVIACNTATAYAKEDIEEFINKSGIDLKVIGVIGAGVRAALENISPNKSASIAIMATAGTVSSGGYLNEINNQIKLNGTNFDLDVYQQAGIGLAGAIDNIIDFIDINARAPRANYKGPSTNNHELQIDSKKLARYNFDWSSNKMLFDGSLEKPSNIQINSIENYISYHLTSLLEQIIITKNASKLKSIILGCTHYPFYTDVFRDKIEHLRNYTENGNYVYQKILEEEITFIDPAIYTAKELYDYLSNEKLFNSGNIEDSEFYISVPNKMNSSVSLDEYGNFTYNYKYGRSVNKIQEYVRRVPFSKNNISSSVADRLSEKIPFTYSLIKLFNENNSKMTFLNASEKIN
jgi:glutamate racemase